MGSNRTRTTCFFLAVMAAAWVWIPTGARAQTTSTDWAWKAMLKHEGLEFAYLFYSKADNHNNGVVLKLTNRNEYPVSYRFRVVLRSEDREVEFPVRGRIDARSILTGEEEGLFFVPFKDGTEILEVGLRGYRVSRSIS